MVGRWWRMQLDGQLGPFKEIINIRCLSFIKPQPWMDISHISHVFHVLTYQAWSNCPHPVTNMGVAKVWNHVHPAGLWLLQIRGRRAVDTSSAVAVSIPNCWERVMSCGIASNRLDNFGVVDSIEILLWLVGGLEHEFYFPFSIWDNHLPIDELIFVKMVIAPPTYYDHGRSGIAPHPGRWSKGFAKISGHVESDLALAMDDFFHPKKMGWSDFHPNLLAVFMFSTRWFWPITIISIWVGYWWHDKYWISSGSLAHILQSGTPCF